MRRVVRRFWRPVLSGILAAVVLLALGGLLSAGGHNFALMMVFFPWAMMLSMLSAHFAWWLPFLLLVAVQFPLYGIVLNSQQKGSSSFWVVLALITLFHMAGVVWCFVFDESGSWRILSS